MARIGVCKLCGTATGLELSHVVPRFIFNWLQQTSATGHFRTLAEPNRRSQDGAKHYWFCRICEDRLSRWESEFARRVFYPFANRERTECDYDLFLLKFCVSLSWRTLLLTQGHSELPHLTKEVAARAELAKNEWQRFLLDIAPNPGAFEQHLLPLEAIASADFALPPNINTYLLRAVDIDVVANDHEAVVWVKLPYFLLLGWITVRQPNEWSGTKVRLRRGRLYPRLTCLPGTVLKCSIDRASSMRRVMSTISPEQRRRIDEAALRNPDRAAASDSFYAMSNDIRLFGKDAFTPKDEG